MKKQRDSASQPLQRDWKTDIDPSRPLSSSFELQSSHPWATSSSEQPLCKPTASELSQNTFAPRAEENKAEKGCLGCSSRPRAVAFVCALVFAVATSIVLPIVLTNMLVVSTSTTNTTTETTIKTTTTTSYTTSTTTTTTQTTSRTTTSTTTSICGVGCARLPISSSSRLAYYNFESNTNDVTGVYPASGLTSPTYSTGYAGLAIFLDALSSEQLTTSPMDLSNKSFTVELWFYLSKIPTQDNAFFGQQALSNVGEFCLFLMSHLGRLYMGFYADDTIGATTLQNATWYHAAFVYDNDQRQRSIYLNGLLDGQSVTGVGPYLGTTGSMTIGSAKVDGTIGKPVFSGYLDELIVSTRAKSACEILNDATLAAYFPLDGSYTDAGPNSLPLTSSGASFMTGYTNQGVYLSGVNSYIQIGGLTGLGQSNYQYSIAFWIYPLVKGVLVHVSANSSGVDWCTPLITFDLSGNIISQVYNTISSIILTGPSLMTNRWSHVVQTYSPTNGQRLYINGVLYASAAASTIYLASGRSDYLTFGNMLLGTGACFNPSPVVAVFQGGVDEMRVYSRELSSIDVCLLAQP